MKERRVTDARPYCSRRASASSVSQSASRDALRPRHAARFGWLAVLRRIGDQGLPAGWRTKMLFRPRDCALSMALASLTCASRTGSVAMTCSCVSPAPHRACGHRTRPVAPAAHGCVVYRIRPRASGALIDIKPMSPAASGQGDMPWIAAMFRRSRCTRALSRTTSVKRTRARGQCAPSLCDV